MNRGIQHSFRLEGTGPRLDRKDPYLRLHFVSDYVRDQERSKRFFLEQMGFHLVMGVRFESGNRWIEVAPPDGTAVLALVRPMPGFNQEGLVGHSGLITLITEDVEAKYREWSEQGGKFSISPQTPEWGGVFCRFEDVDGNSFALAGFDDVTRAIEERRREFADRLEAERRAAQELAIAKQVQARLFPQRLPQAATLDHAGVCIPARAVGGDHYDFVDLGPDNGRIALVVGDIAGKGIAAALPMANLQASLRSQSAFAADQPERLLRSVNHMLFENTDPNAYAPLFYADYDANSGGLRYANRGHLPGLVLRTSGALQRLDATCTVVGRFDGWQCSMSEIRLQEGDALALYTCGVTESFSDREEEFGEPRLIDALRRSSHLPAQERGHALAAEVRGFSAPEQLRRGNRFVHSRN